MIMAVGLKVSKMEAKCQRGEVTTKYTKLAKLQCRTIYYLT